MLDVKTNECKNSCSDTDYFIVDTICYPRCDINNEFLYISTDTYDCLKRCPSQLQKTIEMKTLDNHTIYLCKSVCDEDQFRYGDACVDKCPDGHNYIGYNKICKENCGEDANGQYYYPINEDEPHEYLIYKCVSSCNEAIINATDDSKNYLFYTKSESNTNLCRRKCPDDTHFYLGSNPNECISSCPFNLPFYDNFEEDDNEFLQAVKADLLMNEDVYIKEISENLKNWRFERLNLVEQAILLETVSEIKQGLNDKAIVIDEAVILAKQYCDEQSYKYINGVLDNI